MKKVTILLSSALLVLSFASCKKNYTCTCNVNKTKYVYDYNGQLKSEAQNTCDQQNTAAKLADPNGTCSLTED
jgi:hypothetical protein